MTKLTITTITTIVVVVTVACLLGPRPSTASSDAAERQVRELRRIADALERGCR